MNLLIEALAIGLGGAAGALLRFASTEAVYAALGRGFPYGTLVVNLVGSLAMGLLFVLAYERSGLSAPVRAFFMVGLLGAFTTYSTFALDTVQLLQGGALVRAAGNVALSALGCVMTAYLGILVGRQLFN